MEAAARWARTATRSSKSARRAAGRLSYKTTAASRSCNQSVPQSTLLPSHAYTAWGRASPRSRRPTALCARRSKGALGSCAPGDRIGRTALALAMASGRAGPRRLISGTTRLGQDVRPAGITDLLQPNLVDFSMPPSVQKQLLAKGGCGHVQDMRRGPEEQWVVRDTRDQKMLLDIYRGDTRWTPPVVCTAGKDDWSWAATCRLGGVSPLADAGALQDFLFKPSAAVLKRDRRDPGVVSAALRPRRPSHRCGPDERVGHKKGRRIVVEDRSRSDRRGGDLRRGWKKARFRYLRGGGQRLDAHKEPSAGCLWRRGRLHGRPRRLAGPDHGRRQR